MATIEELDSMTDEEINSMLPPSDVEDEEDPKESTVINDEEHITPPEEPKDPDPDDTPEEPEELDKDKEVEPKEKEGDEVPPSDTPNQYEEFYKAVMSPIKANGKEIQLRTPDEAIKLMQMGANYTQKMQAIAPHRKKIQMLQNAGLLEDGKINYLIDLAQGNPEAVKKLLKETKVDPLDMDLQSDDAYVPGNHSVSDTEVQLQSIVDDLKSTPQGLETLQTVMNWDQASLNEIGKTPSMVATLNEQRQSGVYDYIVNEMEHQKMLGNIPEGTPFIEAYKAVGDYCLQVQQQQQQYQQQQQQYQNLPQGTLNKAATNTATNQIKGAAPSGRSKKTSQQFVDPFSLSDEEFEKQFKNYS